MRLTDAYPLSPMQQGMLFHSLYAGTSGVYVEQVTATLREALDWPAFVQAWERLLERHAILRTGFRWAGLETPQQEVYTGVSLPLALHDWRHLSPLAQTRHFEAFLHADLQRGFDLAQPPLMRVAGMRTGEADYRLVWTFHHALLDVRGLVLALNDLFALYEAVRLREPLALKPPRPYRDYVDWLGRQAWSQAESFWRPYLKGFTAPTVLGAAAPVPSERAHLAGYAELAGVLPAETSAALYALARQRAVSLGTVAQGAWALLLGRYSGQSEVVFGLTRAGRHAAVEGVSEMVGFFVNTLPLRVALPPEARLGEWLQALRRQYLAARPFEHTPLTLIQAWSNVPRGRPLFDTLLNFQDPPWYAALQAQGGPWQNRAFNIRSLINYPLSVDVYGGAQLGLRFEYDPLRFDPAAVARLRDNLLTLLAGMAAEPDAPLAALPVLAEPEKARLAQWHAGPEMAVPDVCLHQLFEAQVARTPDAPAVIYPAAPEDFGTGRARVTYRQLNERANRLAHHLRAAGVGPETLVGVCLERSIDLIVGVIAVMKAGGAYVPLSPAWPPARLAALLQDTRLPVVITRRSLWPDFPGSTPVTVVAPDDPALEQFGVENPVSGAWPEHLVYVIYTSGSTGQPKGVMLMHRNLVNAYFGWERAYRLRAAPTVHLQMANIVFDVFSGDLARALCSGGTLVLCPSDWLLAPAQLYALMRAEGVTDAEFVPAVFRSLIEHLETTGQSLDFMRVLVVASDNWYVGEYAKFLRFCGPGTVLVNSYGLTETAVDSSWYASTRTAVDLACFGEGGLDLPDDCLVPIGRPFGNVQLYVLDEQQRPAPIGVPAELYVGGAGVACGYLNQPQLTAERFLPDPFSRRPGARFYRTGDLARYLPDGNLELLGRLDQQVKLRGFRIEPGEIELTLKQHPAVREAVVTLCGDDPATARLVAYVATSAASSTASPAPDLAGRLRHFLQGRLPDYLVPAAFVFVEHLPLTASGKVDRRALPPPDPDQLGVTGHSAAPRSASEHTLAGIWARVLGLERVGIHDNFFELGGNSLQAMQVASKASAALNRRLAVKAIFLSPTIAELAAQLDAQPEMSLPCDAPVPSVVSPDPAWLTLENRPLLSLWALGQTPPIETVALYYPEQTPAAPADLNEAWFSGLPALTDIIETPLGAAALILLPCFGAELYADEQRLLACLAEALELSQRLGARTVTLTGLIPSATQYGRSLASLCGSHAGWPPISTGHATTVAAVVLAIQNLLRCSGRALPAERLGVLGLGSIGAASLRLMLRTLPHPAELLLCDLYAKAGALAALREQIIAEEHFLGPVRILPARTAVPPAFYAATLIVGATNVPEVLDVSQLRPGTLIVDDSGPHCFSPAQAQARLESQADLLFTEGGTLRPSQPVRELRYLPPAAAALAGPRLDLILSRQLRTGPHTLPSCVLSGLLSARFEAVAPTLGVVAPATAKQHLDLLKRLGFAAADLFCEGYTLPESLVSRFRQRFGLA